eukprot:354534-Prymnesium_polylepis.1
MVVVPFASLGTSHEAAGTRFLVAVADTHEPEWPLDRYFPRVLYAESGGHGATDNDRVAVAKASPAERRGVCNMGHALVWVDNRKTQR